VFKDLTHFFIYSPVHFLFVTCSVACKTDSGNTNTHPSPSKRQSHKYCCSQFSLRMVWLLTDADILASSGSLMRL